LVIPRYFASPSYIVGHNFEGDGTVDVSGASVGLQVNRDDLPVL